MISQHNKEWKPKSSQKLNVSNPGVIGAPIKPISPAEKSDDIELETAKLQDKLSQVNIFENQNVIIAKHIRAPKTGRCQLTFGTIEIRVNSCMHQPNCPPVGTAEKLSEEPVASLSVPAPELKHGSKDKERCHISKSLFTQPSYWDGLCFNHSGLVETGCHYFNSMVEKFGIEPTIKHYGYMVDRLSRAGLVKEALDFVQQMPIEPNQIIWRSIITACYARGELKLGESITKQLIENEPLHESNSVLLSNIYAKLLHWKKKPISKKAHRY
ncbi:hypothetical protein K1719_011989 [Acacia pycnantha]|nr:hypothetical protein K1719_011989 [Acacia pycnantha]